MMLDIKDFCIEKHLSRVLEVGRKTSEFATGEEIVFWPPDVLRLWSEQAGGPMLVATNQHSGMIGLLFATFHEAGIATIENLYVADGFRRQGIANRLLDEFESRAVDARMKMIRSFSHATNAAVSRLLLQRGYSEGVLTQWCVWKPQTMNLVRMSRPIEGISVRQIQPSDLDGAGCDALQDSGLAYEAPGGDCANLRDWLLGSNQIVYGAFYNQRLVGLIVASIHNPTSKATIERILIAHPSAATSIVELILFPLLRDLAVRGIFYVIAHPSIEETGQQGLIVHLGLLGFEKRRIFKVHSKKGFYDYSGSKGL
jgi:GNAT superfamily N-acetyltransferase